MKIKLSISQVLQAAFLFSFLFWFCSCSEDPTEGYETGSGGLKYKMHEDLSGPNAVPGDRVVYHVDIRKKDKVISSSRETGHPVDARIPEGLGENFGGNFLLQALGKMSKGDSLSMLRPLDSIPVNARPAGFENGEMVFFDIKMIDHRTKSEFEAERAKFLEDFDSTSAGLRFRLFKDEEGPLPGPLDGIRYHVYIRKYDQLVFSSAQSGQMNSFRLPSEEEMEEALAQNPILEGLIKMSVGDSLRLVIPADDLGSALRPEWGFLPGDLVLLDLTLEELKLSETFDETPEQE